MSRDDVQRWKDKYLENVEQQERLQRRWDARIDLLRRGLVRSSLAAEGSDKAVDQCMKELREILRRDDMDAGLSGLIPRLEKAVLDSEQRRQQRTQQNIDALGELAQQLLALDLPRELRKPLKQFARDIEDRARQSREIPILLSELSRLQRQALAERRGGDAEEGRPSLLQRLFGGKEPETAAEPSASAPSGVAAGDAPIPPALVTPTRLVGENDAVPGVPAQPLPSSPLAVIESAPAGRSGVAERSEPNQILLEAPRDIWLDSLPLPAGLRFSETLEDAGAEPSSSGPTDVEHAPEAPATPVDNLDEQTPDEAYELPPPMPEPGYSAVAPHIEASLLRLLDGLSLPSGHQPQAEALRERIDGSLNWYELVPVLDDLAVLVLSLADSGQRDFEEYLRQLNERLESFLGHLGDAHAGYTGVLDNARGFDQSLREQVSGLQASVQQATDLNSLKLAVDSRLNGLLASMDEHQREQAEHEQEVSGRLQALMERVNSMEQDAKAFHSHLEDQRQKALTDPLTGLPNRAALSERLELEVARRRRDGGDLLLAVLDIDHFKRINDDFGHLAGDKVLKIIAGELRKRLRQADFIARFGGEEFVVLLPATSLEAGRQLLERLRAAIAACPFHFKGEPLSITCSAGITAFEGNEASEAVFERADQALYRAKRAGRDRLEVA
ncbi:diguanylate cyclase [Pseudomonas aeruginosa]|uniref:GGDEF domain-containing protein n=1 Tax=Pseudomonas aeruginosa TaxID=287 RepID=UPI0033076BF5|nr:diguanylate cyclase [Pseudomonas aeruginosa]HCE9327589.1 diguanylate cyclase [Pseudomonas aeruginosa]HCE9445901.1 diguanylate cyclase [Pseudomonas aeruginosa]HCR1637397.1 diguanylate cyclase [Pseudomonas aeruginosa]